MRSFFGGAGGGTLLRALTAMFLLLVVVTALCAGLHTVSEFDMGWHLSTGRWVVQHRQVPRSDVLSFTSAGEKWSYPPFAGVLLYLVFRAFGYAGLSWLSALACVAVVVYLMRRRDLPSAILALLALQSIAARSSPRADLFSTLFFALCLGELWFYYRELRARLWMLPIVMFCWVNLHPGFVAGLGVMAAYLFLELCEVLFRSTRGAALLRLRKSWPYLAASAAATLLNPWGVGIYRVARTLSGLTGPVQGKIDSSSYIAEYQGVPVSWHLLNQMLDVRHLENGFTWLLAIAVFLVGYALWRRQFGPAILLAAALYGGLAHARYIGIFTITIATVGGVLLGELFAGPSSGEEELATSPARGIRIPVGLAVPFLLLMCGVAILHISDYVSSRTYVVFASDWRFGAGESSWFPEGAAAFIEREQLPGNIFEEYALGGYEVWRLGPRYPDFLDGRSDRLRPDLVAEQRKLYTEDPDSAHWQSVAERWNLNVLLVAVSGFRSLQKLSPSAFCRSVNWRPVYMDDTGMVFLRNVPQNRPWIDRLRIDCDAALLTPPTGASRTRLYDFYLNSGALLFNLQRDGESERALRQAGELFPSDPNVPLLLAGLYTRQQRIPQAEQQYLRSLELNENGGTWFSLGRLYAYQGRYEAAVDAIERAAGMSPQPLDMYMLLGRLELARNRPERALKIYDSAERTSPFRKGGESLVPELYAQIAEGRSEANRLMGRWPEAIGFQLQVLRLTPYDAVRWQSLANLYAQTGQTALAAEAQQKASALQAAAASSQPQH